MKALILAAGKGTRLMPLTNDLPKPMVPIAERPLLEHHVDLLRHHGVTDIAINLHHKGEVIVDHFGDGSDFDVSITYSHEEHLLGSAGAAKLLETFFDQTFFVLYGDVLTNLDLAKLARCHRERGVEATLAVYEVDDPTRFGIVDTDRTGLVQRFLEKPSLADTDSRLANAGIYCLEPEVLDFIPSDRPSDFGYDIYPQLLEAGRAVLAQADPGAYLLDIGSLERYQEAQRDVETGRYIPPGGRELGALRC